MGQEYILKQTVGIPGIGPRSSAPRNKLWEVLWGMLQGPDQKGLGAYQGQDVTVCYTNEQSIRTPRKVGLVWVHEVERVVSLCCWGPVRIAYTPKVRYVSIILWIDGVGLFPLSGAVVLVRFVRFIEYVMVVVVWGGLWCRYGRRQSDGRFWDNLSQRQYFTVPHQIWSDSDWFCSDLIRIWAVLSRFWSDLSRTSRNLIRIYLKLSIEFYLK